MVELLRNLINCRCAVVICNLIEPFYQGMNNAFAALIAFREKVLKAYDFISFPVVGMDHVINNLGPERHPFLQSRHIVLGVLKISAD